MTDNLSILFDRLLPDALELFLKPLLGDTVPRIGDDRRFKVRGTGRFRGAYTADLLRLAHAQKLDGALILVDEDITRVLFFEQGEVIGTQSDMLFERVGRVLLSAGVIEKADAHSLVDCEEKVGVQAACQLIPQDIARWALEKRVWEVGAALYFMGRGHYICIDGRPDLGTLPRVAIDPMLLAMEGMRRYDEWRNGPSNTVSGETLSDAPLPTALDREAIDARTAAGPDDESADEHARREADEIMRQLGSDTGPRLFGIEKSDE
ncbi:MAG: DUF4388 domain-containing protein [Planctomycetota bacterium]|nr:DUF4388 domain-containing protein [Planctomycetota bacterium]